MSANSPQPSRCVIRQFDPAADVARLLRFFNALEALEGDPNPSTEAHVRSQMIWRGHDPARDRWVIEHPRDPASIIGHAWIFPQTSTRAACKVAVHPHWQRQGLGSALLPYVLRRAHKMGVQEVVSGCESADESAARFLDRHGFRVRSSNWFLRLPAAAYIPEPDWPPSYTVQRYNEVAHLPTLVEVLNRSFHDIPGHAENGPGVVTVESLAERLGKTLDPEHIFLAFAPDGAAVGVCRLRLHGWADNHSGNDILDAPGIVPEYRCQNLHIPLALTAIHWQRAVSPHRERDLMLESYGDPAAVITGYEALGFRLHSRFVEYARPVIPDQFADRY